MSCTSLEPRVSRSASYHGDLGEPAEEGEVAYPELRICVEQDADLAGLELMGRHSLEEERHVAEQLSVMHVRLGEGVDDVNHVLRAARNLEVPLAHLLRHPAKVSKHAAVLHAELREGVDDERDALRGELLLGETRDNASLPKLEPLPPDTTSKRDEGKVTRERKKEKEAGKE